MHDDVVLPFGGGKPGAAAPRFSFVPCRPSYRYAWTLEGWTGAAWLEVDEHGKITRRTCAPDGTLSMPVHVGEE